MEAHHIFILAMAALVVVLCIYAGLSIRYHRLYQMESDDIASAMKQAQETNDYKALAVLQAEYIDLGLYGPKALRKKENK